MVEGLSRLILTQVERGELMGIRFHDGMTPQTHQQFVDDTMLMGHPSVQEGKSFKKILDLFAQASGLAVNPNKSQVFFVNTPPTTQRNILRVLEFSIGSLPTKYLGIPMGLGRPKTTEW